MKTHVVALMLVLATVGAGAQSFFIDWSKPNPVKGLPIDATLKRDGKVKNNTAVTKELYFRYNLDKLNPEHRAQLCMSLCWLLYPGEDNPYDREGQILTPGGELPIYIDLTTNGKEGTSTISVTLFEKKDTTDKLDFDVQFVVSSGTSVRDLTESGIRMYPNPANGHVVVDGAALNSVISVGLYDLQGNLVRSFSAPTSDKVTYTTDGLTAGAYRLMLRTRNQELFGGALIVE
ncbi:MAG: T9SS type A sorting domain-containing protein [Candidatus Kapabacteria bacterium]|nr:T9SS type A sorting domain-containing protein [Candidatus Kapabacteria bacterium]